MSQSSKLIILCACVCFVCVCVCTRTNNRNAHYELFSSFLRLSLNTRSFANYIFNATEISSSVEFACEFLITPAKITFISLFKNKIFNYF